MKLKLFLLLFCFMALLSTSFHLYAQDMQVEDQIYLKKIVILETNHSTQYALEVKHLTKKLLQGFKKQIDAKKYAVLDQSDVVSLLSKMQQVQLCIQDCEVQIGKQLGVSMMISTKFQISKGQHELVIKAYDITTEKLIYIQTLSASNFLDLEEEVLTNLSQFFEEIISNIHQNIDILPENKIVKGSGLSFLSGFGAGLEFGTVGGLLGFQYQSKITIKLKLSLSSSSIFGASISFFPNGPKRHQFGLSLTSLYSYREGGIFGLAFKYLFDFGDLNGFQFDVGLGPVIYKYDFYFFPTYSFIYIF